MVVQGCLTPLSVSQADACLWVVSHSPWAAWAMRVQRALELKGPFVLAPTTGSKLASGCYKSPGVPLSGLPTWCMLAPASSE